MSRGATNPPLVLTLGEPAGIAPEITIDAWLALRHEPGATFVFAGDPELIRRRAKATGREAPVVVVRPEEAASVFADALPCLEGSPQIRETPGLPSPETAPAVVESIRLSAELVRNGAASGIVTNPIQKKVLNVIGFPFPGHTEYLGALSEELFSVTARPVMMIAGPALRVVPVTIHIPLKDVPEALTTPLIVETARIVAKDLQSRFGIPQPRLALSGLNPHAGEDGMLGREDGAIVAPAIAILKDGGLDVTGPLPADTMFHAEARERYDTAICMYHDQALIPIKTIAFDEGVNVTLGLPFVRTSPDHGTALDLAGTGKARATSLVASIRLAADLAGRSRRVPA